MLFSSYLTFLDKLCFKRGIFTSTVQADPIMYDLYDYVAYPAYLEREPGKYWTQ